MYSYLYLKGRREDGEGSEEEKDEEREEGEEEG